MPVVPHAPRLRAASFAFRLLLASATAATPAVADAAGTTPTKRAANARRDQVFDLNIPAQSAAAALLAFSKQTKIEVLFSFDDLRKVQSKPVVGRFEPAEALSRLLRDTGFAATPQGRERFIVRPATPATGTIKGRVLSPNGSAAHGIRIIIPRTAYATVTDDEGEFEFKALPAGTYRLVCQATGFQPFEFPGVEVEPERTALLDTQVLQTIENPARLGPFFVKDRTTRRDPFDRSEAEQGPRVAGGNLDIARTENDALPFTVYNRDQIARSGVVNLNEFLQREILDADAASRPPEQDGTLETFRAGSTNLNLRGFGADDTIVLVNGRRLPEALTSGYQTQTPDVNFIPLSLVQQVEVLPVSAASLYSGNAVGGVINIVLRPGVDAESNELALTYTNAMDDYDAGQSSASFLHSRTLLGGRLRVRLNASLNRITPPTEQELGYRLRRAVVDLPLSSSLYRATPNIRGAVPPDTGLVAGRPPPSFGPATAANAPPPLFGPGTASVTSVPPGADGKGGLSAFIGREGLRNFGFFNSVGALATSLDSSDYPYGREQKRSAYFASVAYDVTPWLQLGFDSTYTHTVLHRGYDVFAADLRLRQNSPYNPFGQEALVSLNEMAPALGERHSEAQLEFGSGVLSALFILPSDWRVLLDGQYGRNIAKYRGLAGADYGRWQDLVDRGIYNPLRDTQVFGPPEEFYDRVLIHRGTPGRFVTLGDYTTFDAAVRITHHALSLPTGSAVVNLGTDYRRNELGRHKDERRFADGSLALEPLYYRGRALERYSFFGEVKAPLLPPHLLPSWIRSLDSDAAVRYIASNNSKESSVAPTFAAKMQLPGGFVFRGSVSTSSRYPTPQMSRLGIAPPAATGNTIPVDVREAFDPVQNQRYRVQEETVINPDLQPEGVVTQTAGILFRHGDVHRFRAGIDFVDTRKANELVALGVQDILDLEHLFPDRVVRTQQTDETGRPGVVTTVITGTINSAWRRSHNWNASLDYAWTECFGGTFEAYTRLLYFSLYKRLLIEGARVIDELDHPEGASTGLLRYRAKFGAGWSNRVIGLGMDGHYFHSRVLPRVQWESQGRDRIRPFWQFDAFVQGDVSRLARWLPRGMRAQLRVNNVFSAKFPAYANAASGAGVQAYGDWRGRVYSLSLTTTF